MNAKVGIGIIGTGVGLRTYLPAFREIADADVLAISGSSIERAREFADRHGIKQVLDCKALCEHPSVDLVCVTSPNSFHYDQVLMALEAGKHVLCEKPLTLSVRQSEVLCEFAASRPRQLALVNHQLRFNPYIAETKRLIEECEIGRPYFLRLHQQSTGFSDLAAPWVWSFDASQGGGVRLAMGAHLIDLLLYWFGNSVTSILGAMDPVITRREMADGEQVSVDASSFFSSASRHTSGLSAQISATAAAFSKPAFEFSIYGDAGEIHFDLVGKLIASYRRTRGESTNIPVEGVRDEERRNLVSIFSGSFPYFAQEIVAAIKTNDWSGLGRASSFSDAIANQRLLDAIAQSANGGYAVYPGGPSIKTNFV